MERIVMRLHQEREEFFKTMEDFSLTAHQWSDLEEQQLSHSIKKLASCMEHCATAVSDLVGNPALKFASYIVQSVVMWKLFCFFY